MQTKVCPLYGFWSNIKFIAIRFQPQRQPQGIRLERLAVVHADLGAAASAEQPLGDLGGPDPLQLLFALKLHKLPGKRGKGHVETAGEAAAHAGT